MSNRLGGKQGTAYLGTNAIQPPDYTFSHRDPNQYDINNVSLGDFWLNQTNENLWVLVSLARDVSGPGSVATWTKLEAGGVSDLDKLTGNSGGPVTPDNNANINIVGDGTTISIVGNPGTNTLTASVIAGGMVTETLTGNTGGPIEPTLGNINLVSGIFGFSFDGNPGDSTITLNSTITPDNVVETITGNTGGAVGAILGNINVVGDNVGITAVGNPGTNTVTLSLIGGGNPAETFPTDSGTAIPSGGVLNVKAGTSTQHSGSSVSFSGAGDTITLNLTDGNQNIIIGESAGNAAITGNNNTVMGVAAGSELTSGANNTLIGTNAGELLLAGGHNTCIGYQSGESYISTESSNITINNSGVIGESHTLRIGIATGTSTGALNQSFIQGIRGITPTTADGIPVFIGSTGQLGTVGSGGTTFVSTATGNSGGAVSPLAGNINIVGDGTTAVVVGNPGTNTLTISTIGGGGGDLTVLAGDSGSATPNSGTISIIAGLSTQNSGSSVSFVGASHTIELNTTDSNGNTIIGKSSGNASITGTNNTVFGKSSGVALTSGASNVIVGEGSGAGILTGAHNVIVGTASGSAYTTSESSNILINTGGTVAESNALHIGAGTGTGSGQLNKSFISGIVGITPASADGIPVFIGSAGQLGTVGTGGSILASTLTGNSGGAVGPALGNINIVGDGTTAVVVGNPGTNTLTISTIGGGGGDLTILTGDSGSATPLAGTINIIAGLSTLHSGSSVSFTGASHTIELNVTDANNNTIIGLSSGKAGITGTNNTVLGSGAGAALTTGASNIFLGYQAGSLVTTGNGNFLMGDASLNTILQGSTTATGFYGLGASTGSGSVFLHNWGGRAAGNTFVGYGAGSSFDAGQSSNNFNTGAGVRSLASLTTGIANSGFGNSTGVAITTGSYNTLVGLNAGNAYTTSESSNICIGYNVTGTIATSNTLTIGAGTGTGTGQINKTIISGIRGITTTNNNALPVVIDSAGQLGTAGGSPLVQTLTGNTGGAVSASAGNINIVGDGTTATVVGNPGTNTLTISAIGGGGGGGNPSFMAYVTNTYNATFVMTTPVTIIYDTIAYNLGSAFNLGTSIFTAPTTGLYNFSCGVYLQFVSGGGLATSIPYVMQLTTTLGNFSLVSSNLLVPTVQTGFTMGNSFYAPMRAGDTAFITLVSTNTSIPSGGTGAIQGSTGAGRGFPNGVFTFFGGSFIS